jgi:type I restriction enzyme R subunit
MTRFVESMMEEAALGWFRELGFTVLSGYIAQPAAIDPWPDSFSDVVLGDALRGALRRLNPRATNESLIDAYRTLVARGPGDLIARNRSAHRMLTQGIQVAHLSHEGTLQAERIWAVDFSAPENNDWIVVNQFLVAGRHRPIRADIVVFVNGLPLAVLELKSSSSGGAPEGTIEQLGLYQREAPWLFDFNAVLVAADDSSARVGPIGATTAGFRPWRSIESEPLAPGFKPELQILIQSLFEKPKFLDLIQYFLLFETLDDGRVRKWVPAYFQIHAARVALSETQRAMAPVQSVVPAEQNTLSAGATVQPHGGRVGDRRIGVIWHATGSGRSLTTWLFVQRLLADPRFSNTTVVILSDRAVLDKQLQSQFLRFAEESSLPVLAAASRLELRHMLARMGRGVLFSTIQKFLSPQDDVVQAAISPRHDIVVIANDAYRSQLGSMGRAVREALPNASFIGFTGVPLHLKERSAQMVFGDYISIYDMAHAIRDGLEVPVFYESRLLPAFKLEVSQPDLNAAFEAALEEESLEGPTHQGGLAAFLTRADFVEAIAADVVQHFEQRRQSGGGKALVACATRQMSVALYREVLRLRPAWRGEAGAARVAAIVISQDPFDPPSWRALMGGPIDEVVLARHFVDPDDELSLAIVCDKWLTGFDAPPLSTLYLCKLLRGHLLLQAIARLTRPFPGKYSALVVDYLGLSAELSEALNALPGERTLVDLRLAIADMQREHRACVALMQGFDRSGWEAIAFEQRQRMLAPAQNHVLAQKVGKRRLQRAATRLWRSFTLVTPHTEADQIRNDVGFFLAVSMSLNATVPQARRVAEEPEREALEFLQEVVNPEAITNLFLAAGLESANGDLLAEELLRQIQKMSLLYLAIDVMRKLIRSDLQQHSRSNLALARAFARELDWIALRYDEQLLDPDNALIELTTLARGARSSRLRAAEMGMSETQLAYYDAINVEGEGAQAVEPATLRLIAAQIDDMVRSRLETGWLLMDSARKMFRMEIRDVLRAHAYPPYSIDAAIRGVLEQAEVSSERPNVLTA